MSSSHNAEGTKSIKKVSVIQSVHSQKAYEFYESKYKNMLEFLGSILDNLETPETGGWQS